MFLDDAAINITFIHVCHQAHLNFIPVLLSILRSCNPSSVEQPKFSYKSHRRGRQVPAGKGESILKRRRMTGQLGRRWNPCTGAQVHEKRSHRPESWLEKHTIGLCCVYCSRGCLCSLHDAVNSIHFGRYLAATALRRHNKQFVLPSARFRDKALIETLPKQLNAPQVINRFCAATFDFFYYKLHYRLMSIAFKTSCTFSLLTFIIHVSMTTL